MPSVPLLIRPCRAADLAAVTAIYNHSVRHGSSSFELDPPDRAEMTRRHAEVTTKHLPWLVAERAGEVLGYAYANHFRSRPAYRHCLEDSIYLRTDARGLGTGKALLAELIARCTGQGARQMLAVIGDSSNLDSIGLHAALGFTHAGTLSAVGWKFGRWLDVVLMQRALGAGHSSAPPDRA